MSKNIVFKALPINFSPFKSWGDLLNIFTLYAKLLPSMPITYTLRQAFMPQKACQKFSLEPKMDLHGTKHVHEIDPWKRACGLFMSCKATWIGTLLLNGSLN